MQVRHLVDMKGGWFIGDFEPSALRTKDFEVGIASHKKGSFWPKHYHKEITEVSLVLEGRIKVNGHIFASGEIFVLNPYEVVEPEFLTDCKLVVVKTPSKPKDKHEIP